MYHIYPWEVIAVTVLVAAFLYFRRTQGAKGKEGDGEGAAKAGGLFREVGVRKKEETDSSPEGVYMGLRQQALATTADNLSLPAEAKGTGPYGAVMEMGIPSSVVTLVCFADGGASLYYKTGGGMIGGIGHENVRKAAQEFVSLTRKPLSRMRRATEYPLPEEGRVRFYVLTTRGTFTTETYREDLGDPQSDLGALFYSGQEVVTQMREVQEQRVRPAPAGSLMPYVDDDDLPPAAPAAANESAGTSTSASAAALETALNETISTAAGRPWMKAALQESPGTPVPVNESAGTSNEAPGTSPPRTAALLPPTPPPPAPEPPGAASPAPEPLRLSRGVRFPRPEEIPADRQAQAAALLANARLTTGYAVRPNPSQAGQAFFQANVHADQVWTVFRALAAALIPETAAPIIGLKDKPPALGHYTSRDAALAAFGPYAEPLQHDGLLEFGLVFQQQETTRQVFVRSPKYVQVWTDRPEMARAVFELYGIPEVPGLRFIDQFPRMTEPLRLADGSAASPKVFEALKTAFAVLPQPSQA